MTLSNSMSITPSSPPRPRGKDSNMGQFSVEKPVAPGSVLRGNQQGAYWRGRANAGKVQLRRNTVHLSNLPSDFDDFAILPLSDLHADLSGRAMQRVAELARDLDYDLCVLTGDYRGGTHGDCEL